MAELPSNSGTTILFTDLVGSLHWKQRIGEARWSRIIAEHDASFREELNRHGGREHDNAGDGFFSTFDDPVAAVRCALEFQDRLSAHAHAESLHARIGIHYGSVLNPSENSARNKPQGIAVDVAARLTSLAGGRQILMTADVFDPARTAVSQGPNDQSLQWLAHGPYNFRGLDEPIEVFEVGIPAHASLKPPESAQAFRSLAHGEEEILGWRPAVGNPIPERPRWRLEEKLGFGGTGEVWLGQHADGRQRVFKFCFQLDRLRTLKREVTFLRLLKASLGERQDIVQILDWHYDRPPFYLECEYSRCRDLAVWAERSQGGIQNLPLVQRIELAAQTADALAAAHSCGILHKDVKPSNILIEADPESEDPARRIPRARLADFGIGYLYDRELSMKGILTLTGLTQMTQHPSSGSGTPIYLAPELLEGRQPTVRSDLYALGVVLYQLVVGALGRPLSPGWEREITDPHLLEDIRLCVDGDPARRLSSAGELALRLRTLPERRRAFEAEREHARTAARARMRRRATTASVAVLALIAVALGVALRRESALRTQAEAARQAAEDSNKRLTWENYIDTAGAVAHGVADGRFYTMRDRLEALPEALRGWEWGWIHRLANIEQWRFSPYLTAGPEVVQGMLREALFSPDGKRILTVHLNYGLCAVYDIALKKNIYAGDGSLNGSSRTAGWAPDGRSFFDAIDDTRVRQIDFETSRGLAVFDSGAALLRSFKMNNAGTQAAGFVINHKSEAQIVLWNKEGGRPAASIPLGTVPDDPFRNFAPADWESRQIFPVRGQLLGYSLDDRYLFATTDHILRIELASGSIEHHDACEAAAYSPASNRVVFKRPTRAIAILEASPRKVEVRDLKGSASIPYFDLPGLLLSRDGTKVAVNTGKETLILDAESGDKRLSIPRVFNAMDFSPDGQFVAGIYQRDVLVVNAAKDRSEEAIPLDFGGSSFNPTHVNYQENRATEFNHRRTRAAIGNDQGEIIVFSVPDFAPIAKWKAHDGAVLSLSWSADDQRLISGGADGKAIVWDDRQQAVFTSCANPGDVVLSADLSPDASKLAIGTGAPGKPTEEGIDQAWTIDLATGNRACTIHGHPGQIRLVSFTPDGKYLLTGGYGSPYVNNVSLRVWDAATGSRQFGEVRGVGRPFHVSFSPDGSRFLMENLNADIVMFDLKSMQEAYRIRGALVKQLAWHPDGKRFIGVIMGRYSIFNADDGREVYASTEFKSTFAPPAAFSADGRDLISFGIDLNAHIQHADGWNSQFPAGSP